jgi:ABC-type glycerol-3-phosphate transport system substrate-binding protein
MPKVTSITIALMLSSVTLFGSLANGEDLVSSSVYNCSLPGLEHLNPGQYEGVTANYLSSVTDVSSPNFPVRAAEFEACTGGKIVFSDANNIWEDPINDLGTKTRTGGEIYDGYFMSYSHFPEVSELGLAEHLNDRIREDNARLKWEDVMPKVQAMAQYRKDGESNIDFLMYDGDFFVPIIRLDLLEKYDMPMPNTWDELVELVQFFHGKDINEDGEEDFGLCHFPRVGAGNWDWWFSELVYSTWATSDQLQGTDQGFLFDSDTLEPNIGPGFERAVDVWKDVWDMSSGACDGVSMETGRCAVGYAPPGCWKGTFLNGIARKVNDTVVWQPTMKDGKQYYVGLWIDSIVLCFNRS